MDHMKMTGYGIVGSGYICHRHIKAVNRMRKAKVVAIADIDGKKAQKVAKEYEIEKWFTDYRRIFSCQGVEIVIVCLPTHLHKDGCIASAESGKHVYVEKPMATSLAEAKAMIDVCEKNKVKLCIGHSQRFFPAYRKAKALIKQGYLGDVFKIKGYNRSYVDYSRIKRDWMLKNKINGLVADVGIHYVDSFGYLLDRQAIRVYAEMETFRNKESKLEDEGLFLIKFDNHVIAELEISQNQYMGQRGEGMEIVGSEGSLLFDTYGNYPMRLYSTELKKEIRGFIELEQRFLGDFAQVWGDIHQRFLTSITEDKTPPVTGDDGYKALEVIIAAFESAKTQKASILPLII